MWYMFCHTIIRNPKNTIIRTIKTISGAIIYRHNDVIMASVVGEKGEKLSFTNVLCAIHCWTNFILISLITEEIVPRYYIICVSVCFSIQSDNTDIISHQFLVYTAGWQEDWWHSLCAVLKIWKHKLCFHRSTIRAPDGHRTQGLTA